MERLRQQDLRNLLSYSREIYACRDLEGLAKYLVSTLPKVVPSEWTSYNELNSESQVNTSVAEPQVATSTEDRRILERYIHEHPLINYHRRTRDGQAVKISDFLTQSQWHRLGLYNEFYRKVGAGYKMSIVLPARPPLVIGMVFNRSSKDFSERDRVLLNLLLPHLVQAHQNAESVGQMRRDTAEIKQAVEELDQGVVVFTGKDKVQWCTKRARGCISEYFEPSRGVDRLPESLSRWVEHQRSLPSDSGDTLQPRTSLTVERLGKRLVVRLITDHQEDRNLLLMEESFHLSAAPLEYLGLTRREAEILLSIARGRTDREIAVTLYISPRTVNKHLEHIYRKLGVGNRTEAVARVLEVIQPSP